MNLLTSDSPDAVVLSISLESSCRKDEASRSHADDLARLLQRRAKTSQRPRWAQGPRGLLVCFGSVGFEGSAANPKLVNMEGGSYGTPHSRL